MDTNTIIYIEKKIIQKILNDKSYLKDITIDNFVSNLAKNIYIAIKDLYDKEITIDVVSFRAALNNIDDNVDDKTIESLFELSEIEDTSFEYLKKELRKENIKSIINKELLKDLITESESKNSLNIELVSRVTDKIRNELANLHEDEPLLINTLSDMAKSYFEILNKRNSSKYFYDTGCPLLNKILSEGFAPQKITTIFGASGIGKSTFGLYLINKQINKQIPCLYISLEMDMISTMDRLLAMRNRIPIHHFYPHLEEEGYVQDHAFVVLEKERERLRKISNFLFVEKPNLSLDEIESIIIEAKHRMKTSYLICTIDLITMISDFNKTVQKAIDYEHALNRIHEIVKRQNVHIVGIVQGRRPSEKIKVSKYEDLDKFRPQIEEIKNSSAFEERSRIIISTFRKKHYAQRLMPTMPELTIMEDVMEVDILKQNMGQLARTYYLYDAECALISPYPEYTENIFVDNEEEE